MCPLFINPLITRMKVNRSNIYRSAYNIRLTSATQVAHYDGSGTSRHVYIVQCRPWSHWWAIQGLEGFSIERRTCLDRYTCISCAAIDKEFRRLPWVARPSSRAVAAFNPILRHQRIIKDSRLILHFVWGIPGLPKSLLPFGSNTLDKGINGITKLDSTLNHIVRRVLARIVVGN